MSHDVERELDSRYGNIDTEKQFGIGEFISKLIPDGEYPVSWREDCFCQLDIDGWDSNEPYSIKIENGCFKGFVKRD